MRKLDHTKPYSEDDIAFIRQMGVPYGEDWIRVNAETHGEPTPEPEEVPDDTVTRGVVGADAVGQPPAQPDPATGAPRLVDPTQAGAAELEPDDYPDWSKGDLEAEVTARNQMENTTDVEVVGTGSGGNVTKADLVKGLRLWDQENPGALGKDDDEA